jgi:LmbE family N-acetylglucosaminyl deacetylase
MSNKLLVFATYVDEVPLAAGGLMANHAAAGDEVVVVAMCYPGHPSKMVFPEVSAEKPFGRFETSKRYQAEVCEEEVKGVCEALGISQLITWEYEAHTEALFLPEIVDRVTATINEHEPDIVVTHWPIGDYTDFIGAGTAVLRSMIERQLTKMPQVYFSETLTGRHTALFAPNVYIDISQTINAKRAACEKIWQGQCVDYFFNPFALPIAHFRGRECGVEYAEAYAAMHGSFGLQKQPGRQPTPAGATPCTLRRAVDLLDRKPLVKGVYPIYEKFDSATADQVYPQTPAERLP